MSWRQALTHLLTLAVTWTLSIATCGAQSALLDPSCEGIVGFDAALSVELVDRDSELGAIRTREQLVVSLECDETSVTVRVSDATSERFVGQRVERAERGLVRQLAIVTAELLAALASQLEQPSSAVEETLPVERRLPIALRLTGSVVGSGTPLTVFGGGALGVELEPLEVLRLVVELGAAHTSTSTALGNIETTTFALALSVRFGAQLGAVWLGLGPLVRGGAVFFAGEPSSGGITARQAVLPWLAVGAVAVMAVAIEGSPLSIELDLEGGGLPLTAIALVDGSSGFDLGPAYFGAQLGILLRLT